MAWTWVPQTAPGAWQFFALGVLAMLIIGIGKTGFGPSMAMLAVPLMIQACGKASLANGILLPVLILSDYIAVILWRGKWDIRVVAQTLPGTLAGIALAWALFKFCGVSQLGKDRLDAWLKIVVGVIALGFVGLQAIRAIRGRPVTVSPGPLHANAVGAVAGVTSTFAHAAGPVMAIYLLGQRMESGKFVATTAIYFWIVNQVKLVPLWDLGWLTFSSMQYSLVFVPAAVAGTFLGVWLQNRVGQKQFTGIVYTLLAAAGAHLCYQGTALLGLW
ncbi:MAG: sulfite exporter TauE/SafE family protein [Planctomycetota bacterium]|nr:sulfite exporter TauE/SafE family protein [Planctomycetota bacterium]